MPKLIPVFAALMLLSGAAFAQDAATAPPADQTTPPPAAPDAMPPAPPPPTNPPMTGPQILISTSMGDITVQLDSVRAPKSVANILSYVKDGHYNGTVFYRVVKGFVIQMGSWDANVKGRPPHKGVVIFEGGNGLSNLRGSVALGHAESADSAGADFFINLIDDKPLDQNPQDPVNHPGYAVFGQVVSGMDVVDAIAEVPVGDHGPMPGQAPVTPVVVKKVSLLK